MSEGEHCKAHNNTVVICPVFPAGSYRLDCTVSGVQTPFLLDTGESVTLLRKGTWEPVTASNPQELKDYSAARMVVVDDSPLIIHRSATLDLDLDEKSLATDIVVVSPDSRSYSGPGFFC